MGGQADGTVRQIDGLDVPYLSRHLFLHELEWPSERHNSIAGRSPFNTSRVFHRYPLHHW